MSWSGSRSTSGYIIRRGDCRRRSRVLGTAHPRSRDHAGIRSDRAGSSTISISITSRSSIICCASSTSTDTAAGGFSKWAAAPASISRGSPAAARWSPASTSPNRRLRWRGPISSSRGSQGDFRVADGEQLPFADDCVRPRLRARGRPVHREPRAAGRRVPPRPQARRRGRLPGLQPHFLAERAVAADEGRARAPGRAGPAQVQHRRVQAAARRAFARSGSCPERFPVKSRLHGGWKGAVYNGVFVGAFNVLPRRVVPRSGGTAAFAVKAPAAMPGWPVLTERARCRAGWPAPVKVVHDDTACQR